MKNFKKICLIAEIFENHFDNVLINHPEVLQYRPNAKIEVQKIVDCYNKSLGCSIYSCPKCGDLIFISHTCKSRICSSCGYKYKLERVENILRTAYRCNHRQIVFTIAKELRKYFFFPLKERLNILFKAVTDTIYSIYNESYKNGKKYVSKIKILPVSFLSYTHLLEI